MLIKLTFNIVWLPKQLIFFYNLYSLNPSGNSGVGLKDSGECGPDFITNILTLPTSALPPLSLSGVQWRVAAGGLRGPLLKSVSLFHAVVGFPSRRH